MTLMITRTTRWTAIATLLFLGVSCRSPRRGRRPPRCPRPARRRRRPPGSPSAPAAPAPRPAPPPAAAPAAAQPGATNAPWPRESTEGGQTYTVYQPQIEKWDGTRLHARAAVSVENAASPLRALRRRLVLGARRGGQGQPARRARRLPDRQAHVPLGARSGAPSTRRCSSAVCPGTLRGSRSTGSRPRWR